MFRDKVQAFAGAMMIPIILLVIVGLFVGIGAAFVNYLLPEGSFFWVVFKIIVDMGFMVMNYLPFFFAMGLAFGLAKGEKGWAAFTGFTMLMAFNVVIRTIANIHGWNKESIVVDNLISHFLMTKQAALNFNALWGDVGGVFTYNMGIFSGLLVGAITAWVHNRYYKIELPNLVSFFGGPRFVVIIMFFVMLPLGSVTYYIWPYIAGMLQSVTNVITSSGVFGSFLFGIADKSLLPLGLHHLIAFPIEYTRVGGVMEIDGQIIEGVRNIMFAQAKSPEATGYIVHNFTTGRILIQFGGLPGAAYAIYKTAKPENRRKVASLLIPAVFTCAFVGITEPLEYTFLFVQPLLYFGIHVPLNGLAYIMAEKTHVSILGNQLLFMIPNLFQYQKVHAWSLVYLVPLYFGLYYFAFKFAILKLNSKTPGREDDPQTETKLFTKKDFLEKKQDNSTEENYTTDKSDHLAQCIITALGGTENIEHVSNCATRLRISLHNDHLVAEDHIWKQQLKAIGVVRMEKSIQIIYGPSVITIAQQVKEVLGMDS